MDNNTTSETPFVISDYNILGIEIDSLVRNKRKRQIKLMYNLLRKKMSRKYTGVHLKKKLNPEEMILARGLVIDLTSGNVIRLTNTGKAACVMHGTRFLTIQEMLRTYKEYKDVRFTNFIADPMKSLTEFTNENLVMFSDFLGMAITAVYLSLVDFIDSTDNADGGKTYRQAYMDLMLEFTNVLYQDGGYFPTILKTPKKYFRKFRKYDPFAFLQGLRELGTATFLLSPWRADVTYKIIQYGMGNEWFTCFERVICNVDKLEFFTKDKPFRKMEYGILGVPHLPYNFYFGGNWGDLQKSLGEDLNLKADPRTLYIGCDVMLDIYIPSRVVKCDTFSICEELVVEGVFGYKMNHRDLLFLYSSKWGSFFNTILNEGTFCSNVLVRHSRFCVPSFKCITNCRPDFDYNQLNVKL